MIINDPTQLRAMAAHMYLLAMQDDVPLVAHLDLTYRCDLDCAHCYLTDKRWPELTTAEWASIVDQLRDIGVLRIVWSGGEVFARPDFPELIARAGRAGIASNVKTHAGNLTAERARHLADSGVFRVEVSVYSLREAAHDGFTRRPGSLRATLGGIERALEAGMAVRVAVIVTRLNRHEIAELDAFFRARGCELSFSPVILTDVGGEDTLDHLRLPPDELAAVSSEVLALKVGAGRPYEPREMVPEYGPCGAGRTSLYIAPDGHVWPCVTFCASLGSLREQPLAEIWRSSPLRQELLRFHNRDRGPCTTCAGNDSCAFCMGEAHARMGDYRLPPPSFHYETRARMEAAVAIGAREYTAADWRSVPMPELPEPGTMAARRRPVVPIHTPTPGRGRRAHRVAAGCGRGCPD